MDRLVCPCLNVSVSCNSSGGGDIDGDGGCWNDRPTEAKRLFPESSKDRLVSSDCQLYEVDLDVAGVFAEHKILVVSRLAGDWTVHSCSNCDTDVYITHTVKEEAGRVFVTDKLLDDPDDISSAREGDRYSHVFKIVLHPIAQEDSEIFRRRRVSSMSFGRDDPVMKLAHSQMKSYLNREQEAMEERVKLYEAEQREAFAQLQQQAHNDRSLLFAAIAKARENIISDAISDNSGSFKMTTPTSSSSSGPAQPLLAQKQQVQHPAAEKKGQRSPARAPQAPQQRLVTVTLKDAPGPITSTKVQPKAVATADDDEMFLLDGFEEEEGLYGVEGVDGSSSEGGNPLEERGNPLAFPQSDDEEISTDDSSFRDMSSVNQVVIASSVPVNVPLFPTKPMASNTEQLSSSVHEGFDPAELGDTIRQLALSVQDTGMFGDLPRPRMMGPRGR